MDDWEWTRLHQDELARQHPKRYIAVRKQRVWGVWADPMTAKAATVGFSPSKFVGIRGYTRRQSRWQNLWEAVCSRFRRCGPMSATLLGPCVEFGSAFSRNWVGWNSGDYGYKKHYNDVTSERGWYW